MIEKYLVRTSHVGRHDLVRECYERQIINLKLESCVKKLKAELDESGLYLASIKGK
jgi:hypothetical protein